MNENSMNADSQIRDNPSDKDIKNVFTLVHGTKLLGCFQKSPKWISPTGNFAKELTACFEKRGGAKIYSFEWSGWNRVQSRRKAVNDLKQKLKDQFKTHGKDVNYYLVSHSHGGNVALRAYQDTDIKNIINGVVCLATPFLWVRERKLGRGRSFIFSSTTIISLLILLFAIDSMAKVNSIFLYLIPCLYIAIVMLFWLKYEKIINALIDFLKPPDINPDNLLIIRTSSDEASLFLAFSQFVCMPIIFIYDFFKNILEKITSIMETLNENKPYVVLMVVVSFLLMFGMLYLGAITQSTGFTLVNVGFSISIVLIALSTWLLIPRLGISLVEFVLQMIVMIMILPIAVFMSIVLIIPFGSAIAITSIFLEVFVEVTPPGEWQIIMLKQNADNKSLRHSIYEDERVIRKICRWCK